jgi:hypothetical protein
MKTSKHYRIDKSQDFRKVRTEVVVASLIVIFLVVGVAYVIFDLSKSKPVIDNSKNEAILGTVSATTDSYTTRETKWYEVKVPADWKRVSNPEIITEGHRYYPDRYQGVTGDNVGRRVDIYVNSIPAGLGIDKVVAVKTVGNRIIPIETSPQCYAFTDVSKENPVDYYASEWKGIQFTCMTSRITDVLGAIERNQTEGIVLDSDSAGTVKFFLVYTDSSSRMNNSIFYEILKSFKAK